MRPSKSPPDDNVHFNPYNSPGECRSQVRNSMLTRREILAGTITVGAIMRTRTGFAKASQPATPVNFEVPAGACDCHTHIHGDPASWFTQGWHAAPPQSSADQR